MQAHLPLHNDYFSSALQDSYLPPADAQNYTTGFSRGSSLTYPHPDYRYSLDRGELVASRLCSSNLVGPTTLDATGLGFAGNSLLNQSGFPAPEDISLYSHQQQQPWDWDTAAATADVGAGAGAGTGTGDHVGLIASGPIYTRQAEEDFFGMAKPSGDLPSAVCSPAPQLPTPAAMAVLLNPGSRSEVSASGTQQQGPTESAYDVPPLVALLRSTRPSAASSTRNNKRLLVERVVATQEGVVPLVPDPISREKKHACTMCHKRFDRPSTLRKHLLVHTGEKAFVCDTCGRRFGVASNLNRHVKRCILKPVNTPSPPSKSSPSSPTMDSIATPASSTVGSPGSTSAGRRNHGSGASQNTSSPQPYTINTTPSHSSTRPPGQKRRRRAPSPSQWVPVTLRNFNFTSTDTFRVTQVPLPPVRPNFPNEERDSWDENVGQSPYHPCAWKGILPGPGLGHGIGLGGKDVRNLNLGGRGGTVLGRVLVF